VNKQNNPQMNIDALINSLSSQGYVICENFLPQQTISALRDEAHKRHVNLEMHAAKTGLVNKTQSDIRGDQIAWLNEQDEQSKNNAIDAYFEKMHALRVQLNQQLFMNLQTLETHFAVYPIGSAYQKHLDQFSHGNDAKARQLSSILYLNRDWQVNDGGELRLYRNDSEYLDILPTAGRLVLFLSEKFWHEVLPAKRERISLTGWFRNRNLLAF
jgi:SM-20-related protein